MDIHIFSVSDKNPIDILYVQLNSIKKNKKKDTVINYYLIIEDVDTEVKEYFNDLISYDFNIHFINARQYENCINPPKKSETINSYIYFIRCLAPIIFPYNQKILYLDPDVLMINAGIEELWNIDINDYFLVGTLDIEESFRDIHELLNVGKNKYSNNYFNAGVMLLNLSKIRNAGFDIKIMDYLKNWPEGLECILYDQTLLNWLFKDGVKIIDSKYNNSILSIAEYDRPYYEKFYNTKNLLIKYKDACFLHFKGYKIWNQVPKAIKKQLPYYKLAQIFYLSHYNKLKKQENALNSK